jgi:hypothetical protein
MTTDMPDFSNTVIHLFSPEGFVEFMGLGILVIMVLYSFIAFILTRQVSLMNSSFKTPLAPLFTTLAYAHMLFAILLSVITFIVI